MSLRDAVNLTVYSNPEIGEAVFDRNAIGFELKQAKGEWLPRLDLEFRGGTEWADRSFTRERGQFFFLVPMRSGPMGGRRSLMVLRRLMR